MNTPAADTASRRHAGRRRAPVVFAVAAVVAAVAFIAIASPAFTAIGTATLAAAAIGGLALGFLLNPGGGSTASDEQLEATTSAARTLLSQVIPVWQRTTELARSTAHHDAEALTARFATVHEQLELALGATASAPTLDGAAVDALLERHQSDLELLRADAREAVDALATALAAADPIEGAAQSLARLTGDLQRIASATHLLGLNASVEAARSAGGNGAFEVVARDVRELAAQSRQTAERVNEEVARVRQQVEALRGLHAAIAKDDEDLALRSQLNARRVLRALLGSLGDTARQSNALRDTGQHVQAEIEAILMGLQGHDRINQMLESVIDDLGRMRQALETEATCAAASPVDWLARLESSYTMEEMRSSHHDTKSIAAQAAVEFF